MLFLLLRKRLAALRLQTATCTATAAIAAAAASATAVTCVPALMLEHEGRWAWQRGCSIERPVLLGFGNPTVDVSVTVTSTEMDTVGLQPGSDAAGESQDTKQRIVDAALALPVARRDTTPGGSALNSMRVAAWAASGAIRVAFLGSIGTDEHAEVLVSAMSDVGVEPLMLRSATQPTGLCASLIEPESKDRALAVVRFSRISWYHLKELAAY